MSDFWDDDDINKTLFWDDDVAPVSVETGPSELDSAGRGLAQGVSFGLRDEGAGAIESPIGGLKEIANKFGADFSDEDIEAYRRERDASRELDAAAKEANPKSYLGGEVGGAVATSFIPGLGALNAAKGAKLGATAAAAARQGALYGLGGSEAENIGGIAADAALGAGGGALGGAAGYGAGKVLSKAAKGVGNLVGKAAPSLASSAENLAVKATGATGRESEKFADNAGRELLDRGIVKFGDSPRAIANRAGQQLDKANAVLDDTLKTLDASGVEVQIGDVIKSLQDKVKALKQDPAESGTVRKLLSIIEDIKASSVRGAGEATENSVTSIPISAAEKTKRGFNKIAGNWMDQEASAGGKAAYRTYRDAVETAATDFNPELGGAFKEAKTTYGLLAPIQEAASRRANTLSQSPLGGLGDTAAAAVGGGPLVAARRVFAPRLASSGAVTADALSKMAKSAPQILGKFAPIIQNATQRGTQAVAATHFILEQSNPEYREMIKSLNEQGDNQ